ncbi:MAG: nitrilase-related carbon-nitrogen hydrolase [Acidobacteriota bacterium]|nr:carbon-nitrogen hydrolase [Blastocatellia bacterium]MDW8238114.1 nitrilase-related carbon-nitrogen hydrolase [Acidobacteriota bacterium]
MKIKVALAQIKPALGDLQRNLDVHLELTRQAADAGAQVIVFPELSLTGYYLEDLVPDVAIDPTRSDTLDQLLNLGQQYDIDLVIGFIEVASDYRFFNSAAYLSQGQIAHIHRKVYLPTYGMFDEGRFVAAGDVLRAFDTRYGRMGILICEDLWHPSTLYLMAHDGAQVLLAMSAGPGRGLRLPDKLGSMYAWEAITRSAAQSYMLYVVYVNRVGVEDGVIFSGGSELIDPFGRCLVKAKTFDEDLCYGLIDALEVRRARTIYPLLRDERLDLTLRELTRIYNKRHQLE